MSFQTSILQFPSLKRTRRYGAKVRTGCLTCKARRIKCDETKPSCKRCTSTGRKCDGYVQRSTIESGQTQDGAIASSRTLTTSWSGEGLQFLEFYHHCAVGKLSNHFDNGFWSRTALQMAQSEPSIRHALIALGYLTKTESGSIKDARMRPIDQDKVFDVHYGKAVGSLIDSMSKNSCAVEVGLTACLLFVCIELIRGNFLVAFSHLQSGLKIISEVTYSSPDRTLPKSRQLNTTQSSRITTIFKFSGSRGLLDDTLIPMFMRNIPPAMIFGTHIEEIFEIPMPDPTDFNVPFTTFFELQMASFQLRNASALFARTMATKVFIQAPLTVEDYDARSQLLDAHHSWFTAFKALEKTNHESHVDKIMAASLKLGHYSTYILVDCAMDLQQTRIDEHLEDFKFINRNARIVLEAMDLVNPLPPDPYSPTASKPTTDKRRIVPIETSAPGAHFTFEISVIPALFYVATRCRCPTTRREAVALLETSPPREGIWDAETHVALAQRVIEIEESSLDPVTRWPTESSRLWCSVQDANGYRNGKILITFALVQWVKDRLPQVDDIRPVDGADRSDAQWQEFI